MPLVFLCGKANSKNRKVLHGQISAIHSEYSVVYAEDVWNALRAIPGLNALKMEEIVAALSDAVVIFVESPGTFAELGAFSMVPDLRSKMLVVLESRFEFAESFINTGPVRLIVDASVFKGPECARFPISAAIAAQLVGVLGEGIQTQGRPRDLKSIVPFRSRLKDLLLFLCDLVYMLGPCTEKQLLVAMERAKPEVRENEDDPTFRIRTLLAIAEALNFVQKVTRTGRANVYYRRLVNGRCDLLFMRSTAKVHQARARWLNAIGRVAEGRYALAAMRRDVA
jgi:hypothetical protein